MKRGERLGDFEVIERLGAGAQGQVYRGRHVETGVEVALKVIAPALLENPEVRVRFGREARVQALLEHPGIVRIHDADLEGRVPYLAMELVEGRDLAAVLEARGPLPVEEVAPWFLQLGEGLDALHARGAVHRDLKPANLMVRADGRAVVMDLGLAALDQATRVTRTGSIVGTPLYLPPELLRGQDSGPRSDQWQMGAVLFECLTGRRLVPGRSLQEIGAAIARGCYNRFPEGDGPEVPGYAQAVVMRAVAQDPARRFPDLREMARALADPGHEDRPRTEEIAAEVLAAATGKGSEAPGDARPPGSPREEGPAGRPPGPPERPDLDASGSARLPRILSSATPARPTGRAAAGVAGLAGILGVLGVLGGWFGAAGPPREIGWRAVGDVLVARFVGGDATVRAEVDGRVAGEAFDLPDGRREIRIRGLRPGSTSTVRLTWDGGVSLPEDIRVGEPAILPAPSLAELGVVELPVRRSVELRSARGGPTRVVAQPRASFALEEEGLSLAWEEGGVPFSLELSRAELLGRAVDGLRPSIEVVDLPAIALRRRGVDSADFLRARDRLLGLRAWLPGLLGGDLDSARARWLWDATQDLGWVLASREARGEAPNRAFALAPGAPGHRSFSAGEVPGSARVELEMTALHPGGRTEPGRGVKLAPDLGGGFAALTQARYRDYPTALRVRWPDGLPAGGALWFGVDPDRLAASTQIRVRPEDPDDPAPRFRFWGARPGGALSEEVQTEPIGVFLSPSLAPPPGTPMLVEVLPLVEEVAKGCRFDAVFLAW